MALPYIANTRYWMALVFFNLWLTAAYAKTQDAPTTSPKPSDLQLEAAEAMVGRALFVRGFYLWDELSFDATGHVLGTPKTGDWTLAGMDVKKVVRRGAREIQLDGVRVAIHYNRESGQFERRPQNQEPMRIRVVDTGSIKSLETALDAIFAQGIDPRLQQATPLFWQHFFNPGLAWPADLLGKQAIVPVTGPGASAQLSPPVAIHQEGAHLTPYAEHDRVRGAVLLHVVIDPEGIPRRLEVVQPLGYGLDERAVQSVTGWRFKPATRAGKPVAAMLLINVDFEPPSHP